MTDKTFEVPDSMRDMAEQSVNQAKSAYDQFVDATKKAQEMAEQASGTMLDSTKEIQAKAAAFTAKNMQAGFDLANKLVTAKDFKDAIEIQSAFAQKQMETYSAQAQELTAMMTEATKKAQ